MEVESVENVSCSVETNSLQQQGLVAPQAPLSMEFSSEEY